VPAVNRMSRILRTSDDLDDVVEISCRQMLFVGVVTYVWVDTVVLNMTVEYFDKVAVDRFAISVLTVILPTVLPWAMTPGHAGNFQSTRTR